MRRPVTVEVPCKVNLYLGVHAERDARGYHRVDSLMVPVALCDTVVVIGEPQSANTSELYRLAVGQGVRAFFIPDENAIRECMLECHDLGVCAGASVSPAQVDRVVQELVARGGTLTP